LLFVLEDEDVGVSLLLDLLLEIERKGLLVKLTEKCEALERLIFSGSVLIDLVLNDARDHCNLLRVVLRPCHLHGESKGSERWTLLVDIIYSADAVFRAGDRYFLLAPCALEVACLNGVAKSQPAGSLNLLLQNE